MGFFDLSLAASKPVVSLVPKCGACKLELACKSPKIPVQGEGRKGILLVGEYPDWEEDRAGRLFQNESGKYLRDVLGRHDIDLDIHCWKTSALICATENSRWPSVQEVDYCNPNLVNTINKLKPRVIVPLGYSAIRSVLSPLRSEAAADEEMWVGWKIPTQRWNAWVCPTFSPRKITESSSSSKKDEDKRKVSRVWFERHLKEMVALPDRPWDVVPEYKKQVKIVLDPKEASAWLDRITQDGSGAIAFDYETNCLNPENPRARIYSCAVCWNGKETIAYPWVGDAVSATKRLLSSKIKKIGANCFSGDTKFLTREYGDTAFEDVVGKTVTVLNRHGRWVSATIHCFGEQETTETTFCRRNYQNTVRATAGHRWIMSDGSEKTTISLQRASWRGRADAVPYMLPPREVLSNDDYIAGIRHGIVLGDGSLGKISKKGKLLFRTRLCGEKKELLKFFDGCSVSYYPSSGSDPIVWTHSYKNLKAVPEVSASDSYLIGFFRGLLATDGCVNHKGQISICNRPDIADWCVRTLPRVGYYFQCSSLASKYFDRGYENQYNHAQDTKTVYLSRESVLEDDLLRSVHQKKYKKVSLGDYKFSGFGETRKEKVYCAVVPEGESFVLSGGLLTGNCKYEWRWTKSHLGIEMETHVWDTVLCSHILDNRRAINSADFQAFVRLGQEDWSSTAHPYLVSKEKWGINRIDECDLRALLMYNGMDAVVEYHLATAQRRAMFPQGATA